MINHFVFLLTGLNNPLPTQLAQTKNKKNLRAFISEISLFYLNFECQRGAMKIK